MPNTRDRGIANLLRRVPVGATKTSAQSSPDRQQPHHNRSNTTPATSSQRATDNEPSIALLISRGVIANARSAFLHALRGVVDCGLLALASVDRRRGCRTQERRCARGAPRLGSFHVLGSSRKGPQEGTVACSWAGTWESEDWWARFFAAWESFHDDADADRDDFVL
jgi:hypothetical protein